VIDLSGKRALVTGAGRGIGQAIAVAMAEHGCRVAINDLTADRLEATAQRIAGQSTEPLLVPGDVGSSATVNSLVRTVTERFDGIDILVNNAGVITALLMEDISDEEWERTLRINLTAMFYTCRAVVPQMKQRGSGKIINVGSNAAKTGEKLLTHYSASKFGVLGFSQALAMELAAHHVNVNCVCPVWCDTNMMASMAPVYAEFANSTPEAMLTEWAAANPWGRNAQPTDVAKMCIFLASDYAEFITGQGVNVSGGEELH
jgi:meso-butanediol dehydrogenase / (S,S)-butanediol dehydrogenase / diacetyl reductase